MQIKVKRSRKRIGKAHRNIQKIRRLRRTHRRLFKKNTRKRA